MEIIEPILDDLSLDQLEELETVVKHKIFFRRVNQKLEEDGYYLSPQKFECPDNIKCIKLFYYVILFKDGPNLVSPYEEQNRWVKHFGFEYKYSSDDEITDMYQWGHFGPDNQGRGYVNIYLYFETQPCPTDGQTFKCLVDGEIEKWTVKDDKLYHLKSQRLIGPVTEWDQLNVYVI